MDACPKATISLYTVPSVSKAYKILSPFADIRLRVVLFSSRRSSRIKPRETGEREKSGTRTKKKREGGGKKQRKRWKRGDYRQPIVKKSARPLAASVF